MDPKSLLSIEGGLSAPGPYSSKPFLTLLKTDLPKLSPNKVSKIPCFCFLLSKRHSHGRAQLSREIRYVIKAQEFCKMLPTLHLCRPHAYSHAYRYHHVCENWWAVVSLSRAEEGMWNVGLICYQPQLVFPADAHSPGVSRPHKNEEQLSFLR